MKIKPQLPIKYKNDLIVGDIIEILATASMDYSEDTVREWDGKTFKIEKIMEGGVYITEYKFFIGFRNILTKENLGNEDYTKHSSKIFKGFKTGR